MEWYEILGLVVARLVSLYLRVGFMRRGMGINEMRDGKAGRNIDA